MSKKEEIEKLEEEVRLQELRVKKKKLDYENEYEFIHGVTVRRSKEHQKSEIEELKQRIEELENNQSYSSNDKYDDDFSKTEKFWLFFGTSDSGVRMLFFLLLIIGSLGMVVCNGFNEGLG